MPPQARFDLDSYLPRASDPALADLLRQTRLLTLTGPPGVGKSRLARHLARSAAADLFTDGVVHVDLRDSFDPRAVPLLVLAAFGPDAPHSLSALIRGLDRSAMLVVLDDCDGLVAACADLAITLLLECPNIHVLITSREALRISGERVWVVESLSAPPMRADLEEVSASEAVQLFAARAQAIDQAFSVVESNAAHVGAITRRLDGMPQALELAAAHLNVLSVAQLDAELATSLTCLNDAHAAHGHQMTLRQSLDLSVAVLTESQQRVLRRVSVLAGVWPLDAARQVCADDEQFSADVLPTLRELIDKSLVCAEPGRGAMRFSLTGAIREYGAELLEAANETDVARARHAEWCHGLAAELASAPNCIARTAVNDVDNENLRMALQRTLERNPTNVARVLVLAEALHRLRFANGAHAEGLAVFERILGLPGIPPTARASAALHAAEHARWIGQLATADHYLAAARAAGAPTLETDVKVQLNRGDWKAAESLLGNVSTSWAIASMAEVDLERGQLDAAAARAEAGLAGLGDPAQHMSTSSVLRTAGLVALARDEVLHAEAYFGRALEAAREEQQTYAELGALLAQARLCLRNRQPAAAARKLAEALPIARNVESVLAHVRTVEHVAVVLGGSAGASLAYAAAGCRQPLNLPRWPSEQAFMASLGDLPTDSPGLSIGQALQRASEQIRERLRGASQVPPAAEQLTPREWEVAQLIARGYTNREVADALTISGGTARAHVERIRTKLGSISRSEIAARLSLSET